MKLTKVLQILNSLFVQNEKFKAYWDGYESCEDYASIAGKIEKLDEIKGDDMNRTKAVSDAVINLYLKGYFDGYEDGAGDEFSDGYKIIERLNDDLAAEVISNVNLRFQLAAALDARDEALEQRDEANHKLYLIHKLAEQLDGVFNSQSIQDVDAETGMPLELYHRDASNKGDGTGGCVSYPVDYLKNAEIEADN